MAAPHLDPLALKHAGKASGPEEGMGQVQLVNPGNRPVNPTPQTE